MYNVHNYVHQERFKKGCGENRKQHINIKRCIKSLFFKDTASDLKYIESN